MDELIFTDYVVTCTTVPCGNGGIPIVISAPAESPNFMCGVCSQSITSFYLGSEVIIEEEPVSPEETA